MATTVSIPIPTPPLTPPLFQSEEAQPQTESQSNSHDHDLSKGQSSPHHQLQAPAQPRSNTTLIPLFPSSKTSHSPTALITQIDTLLEIYLENLDTYTRLREQLSKTFASGFLSIAHANRTTTTGRRYGEESYDGRMKAGRRVRIQEGSSTTTSNTTTTTAKDELAAKIKHTPTPEDENTNTTNTTTTIDLKINLNTFTLNTSNPPPKNPLHQFGLLTPPSLRAAQTSFTSAFISLPSQKEDVKEEEEGGEEGEGEGEGSMITGLINTMGRLRWLEREIGRLRGKIAAGCGGSEEEGDRDSDDKDEKRGGEDDEEVT